MTNGTPGMNADDGDPVLRQAITRLRAGDLVVMPTETVYGLAADAEDPAAVGGIFALKGRPASRPLIVHIPRAEDLDAWTREVPEYARILAAQFWPGPLSLVLRRGPRVPDAVTGGQDTVALRVPAHPVAQRLLEAFDGGLAAPSANRYGRISPTTPDHVRAQFGADTPLILDGGPCRGGIESTIVGCTGATPEILRPGLVTAAQIAAATGLPVAQRHEARAGLRTAGQDESHYAPTTPTRDLDRDDPSSWTGGRRRRAGFLGFGPPPPSVAMSVRLPPDPAAAARELYAGLHRLDGAGLDVILLEPPPAGSEWDGVRDRLRRAGARGRVRGRPSPAPTPDGSPPD